jgi:hypothetical protein
VPSALATDRKGGDHPARLRHVTEVFTGFGERGISAESITSRTVSEVRE